MHGDVVENEREATGVTLIEGWFKLVIFRYIIHRKGLGAAKSATLPSPRIEEWRDRGLPSGDGVMDGGGELSYAYLLYLNWLNAAISPPYIN